MQQKIVRIEKPCSDFLEWAINLAVRNVEEYTKSRLLRHSKSKSIRNRMNNFVFCFVEDKPVGFITFRFSRDTAYVFELHVEEEYRSLGIGTSLLNECKGMYSDTVRKIVLYVHKENPRGIRFYEVHGFEVNERYKDKGFREMVFRK